MKTSLQTILLTTAALSFAAPARANDPVADLLSAPAFHETQVQTATSSPTVTPEMTVAVEEAVSTNVATFTESSAKPTPILAGDPAAKGMEKAARQSVPQVTVQETTVTQTVAETIIVDAVSAEPTYTGTTMQEVLSRAYATNPTLKAERERLRIQYENVAQADARRRPTLDAQGNIAGVYSDVTPGSDDSFLRKDVGLTLLQPVWTGGRLSGFVDQQLTLSDAAIAGYEAVGSSVFLDIVAAAFDVQRELATIELQQKNHEVLSKQLDAAQKGFEVGDRTRTDVSQARARLAGADASLAAAKADYETGLARFTQLTGLDARKMNFAPHVAADIPLPNTLQQAIMLAELENPSVLAANYAGKAAEQGVDVARADMSPTLNIVGGADHAWDPTANTDRSKGASLGLRASMNLYEGGATTSRIRQAKFNRYEQQNRLDEATRAAVQQVTSAWNAHHSARAQIVSFQAQVDAAKIARDGVYKEQEVGLRTVLDALNAEREYLDAQVGLTRALRDAAVADYSLLSAIGRLTPSRLGVFTKTAEKQTLEGIRGNHSAEANPL